MVEFGLVRLIFLLFGKDLNKNAIVDAWMEDNPKISVHFEGR